MAIQVHRVEYKEIQQFRELYRHEANCQIIHDAGLSRGWSDPYLIVVNGQVGGYGAVYNQHYAGRLMEFHVFPEWKRSALWMFRELLTVSRAIQIEAQTNMPLALAMLIECGQNLVAESVLFRDFETTSLKIGKGFFRQKAIEDRLLDGEEPDCEWLVDVEGQVAATGGFLCHYNPPYGDIYMETVSSYRLQGYGSYLVQELKRVCYETGRIPAARCNPNNLASRKTLVRAGFIPVGHLLAGDVALSHAID